MLLNAEIDAFVALRSHVPVAFVKMLTLASWTLSEAVTLKVIDWDEEFKWFTGAFTAVTLGASKSTIAVRFALKKEHLPTESQTWASHKNLAEAGMLATVTSKGVLLKLETDELVAFNSHVPVAFVKMLTLASATSSVAVTLKVIDCAEAFNWLAVLAAVTLGDARSTVKDRFVEAKPHDQPEGPSTAHTFTFHVICPTGRPVRLSVMLSVPDLGMVVVFVTLSTQERGPRNVPTIVELIILSVPDSFVALKVKPIPVMLLV